jgi:hypothetical protein
MVRTQSVDKYRIALETLMRIRGAKVLTFTDEDLSFRRAAHIADIIDATDETDATDATDATDETDETNETNENKVLMLLSQAIGNIVASDPGGIYARLNDVRVFIFPQGSLTESSGTVIVKERLREPIRTLRSIDCKNAEQGCWCFLPDVLFNRLIEIMQNTDLSDKMIQRIFAIVARCMIQEANGGATASSRRNEAAIDKYLSAYTQIEDLFEIIQLGLAKRDLPIRMFVVEQYFKKKEDPDEHFAATFNPIAEAKKALSEVEKFLNELRIPVDLSKVICDGYFSQELTFLYTLSSMITTKANAEADRRVNGTSASAARREEVLRGVYEQFHQKEAEGDIANTGLSKIVRFMKLHSESTVLFTMLLADKELNDANIEATLRIAKPLYEDQRLLQQDGNPTSQHAIMLFLIYLMNSDGIDLSTIAEGDSRITRLIHGVQDFCQPIARRYCHHMWRIQQDLIGFKLKSEEQELFDYFKDQLAIKLFNAHIVDDCVNATKVTGILSIKSIIDIFSELVCNGSVSQVNDNPFFQCIRLIENPEQLEFLVNLHCAVGITYDVVFENLLIFRNTAIMGAILSGGEQFALQILSDKALCEDLSNNFDANFNKFSDEGKLDAGSVLQYIHMFEVKRRAAELLVCAKKRGVMSWHLANHVPVDTELTWFQSFRKTLFNLFRGSKLDIANTYQANIDIMVKEPGSMRGMAAAITIEFLKCDQIIEYNTVLAQLEAWEFKADDLGLVMQQIRTDASEASFFFSSRSNSGGNINLE